MSLSFLTLICLGTAFTAVSFFIFSRNRKRSAETGAEYWRAQGKKLNSSIFAFVCAVIFPVLILCFSKQNSELLNIFLPTMTIAIISLLRLKSSR